MMSIRTNIAAVLLLFLGISTSVCNAMNEGDRMEKYNERGYEWPLPHLVPDTPGWNTLMKRRFEQIEQTIPDTNERYNAWMQVMSSALVQPNFTENG